MPDGKILDLENARLLRSIREAHVFMERTAFTPQRIIVDGVDYQWTEEGYLSDDGHYLQMEDL